MTLFRSEHRSLKYISMTGELKSSRPRAGTKRPSSEMYRSDYDLEYDCYHDKLYDRVFDYQRVPVSMPTIPREVTPPKRPRSTSSALRRSRDRLQSKHRSRISSSSSSRAKLKMEELQSIKRELTVIKVQIDELLDSLDQMDRQRRDHSDGSVTCSPYRGSVSSVDGSAHSPTERDRESPEPGEASDGESQQMNNNNSDLEYM